MTMRLHFAYRLVNVFMIVSILGVSKLLGQDASELAELRRQIQVQKDQIRQQQAQIERQQQQLDAIDQRLQTMAPPASNGAVLASTSQATSAIAAAFAAAPAKPTDLLAQATAPPKPSVPQATGAKPEARPLRWYEKYSVRGYAQLRTNRIFEDNAQFQCAQCDASIGANNNLLIRRARIVLSGDINDRISLYFQPDFASAAGNLNFGQIRDLYFDVGLDKKKEYRLRFGQSKVPFGFDNLQSSQNRIALDRSDPINSATPNERDLGAYLNWAPDKIRKRLAQLGNGTLKGTGDYGLVALGVYNGQSANRPEANNNMHAVARVSYPFELKNKQVIETGLQAYTGRYAVGADQRSAGVAGPINFDDRRAAASFVLYPQPFGIQAEYNIGTGPRFNPLTRRIEQHNLNGGYVQATYVRKYHAMSLNPYFRYQYFNGGKKQETDARYYLVKSFETGLEWQQSAFMEWTAEFVHGNRTFEDFHLPVNQQTGNLLRLQLQINY